MCDGIVDGRHGGVVDVVDVVEETDEFLLKLGDALLLGAGSRGELAFVDGCDFLASVDDGVEVVEHSHLFVWVLLVQSFAYLSICFFSYWNLFFKGAWNTSW